MSFENKDNIYLASVSYAGIVFDAAGFSEAHATDSLISGMLEYFKSKNSDSVDLEALRSKVTISHRKTGSLYLDEVPAQVSATSNYYFIKVDIDTDDDFLLDCGDSFTLVADDKDSLISKCIDKLSSIKVVWASTWSVSDSAGVVTSSGDKSGAWDYLRDAAIQRLKDKEEFAEIGGNNTLEYSISLIRV